MLNIFPKTNRSNNQANGNSPVRRLLKQTLAVCGLLLTMAHFAQAGLPEESDTEKLKPVFGPAAATTTPWGFSNGTYPGFHAYASPNLGPLSISRDTPRALPRDPNDFAPSQIAPNPRGNSTTANYEKIQQRLNYRYANPVVVRFIHSVTPEQAISLYRESTNLIDSRHLQPSSYATRVQTAATSLMYAVENRIFLRANQIEPNSRQINSFRSSFAQFIQSRPITTAGDSLNALYSTIQLAGRHLGLRPTVVALEFVYGATDSLDKYSAFEPEDTFRGPSAALEEEVVGIGVEIKPHDHGVLIVRPLRGGPAAEVDLRKGDVITSVNGKSLEGQSLDYAADLIRGPAGTPILLGILRDEQRIAPVTLTRRRFQVRSISEAYMLDGDSKVGYVRLEKFTSSADRELDAALWSLHRQGMKSLVFDVRGNPGGLLTSAISISNKFLPQGVIVSTHGRLNIDESRETATYEKTWKVPLVVLIDKNSASASEIFAAAIQENRRGVVVGHNSYGKGTVQTHFPMRSVSGNLRLTTAKFYSPTGREMAGSGVKPDVEIDSASSEFPNAEETGIRTAGEIAKSDRLRKMSMALSGRRIRDTRDYQLPS